MPYDKYGRPITGDVKLEDYASEWQVEDPNRYERLSGRKVMSTSGKGPAHPGVQVITLVLEVPLEESQRVTQALGNARKLRDDGRSYLTMCARHADQTLPDVDDHVIESEAQNAALVDLASRMADRLALQHDRGEWWAALREVIAKYPGARRSVVRETVDKLRHAISERKAEVAAELLSKYGDDE